MDIVVVRVNSAGGSSREWAEFLRVFHAEYKPRFRTVAWIETAVGTAAMSVWPINEIVMTPQGQIGRARRTDLWGRRMFRPMISHALEEEILLMEDASRLGRHDPRVMRAMQIMEPLTARITTDGHVDFFQDLTGDLVLSSGKEVLTLSAQDAVRFRIANGFAASRDELMRVMRVPAWEAAGEDAAAFLSGIAARGIDVETRFDVARARYTEARRKAVESGPAVDRAVRLELVSRAHAELEALRQVVAADPYFTVQIIDFAKWLKEEHGALQQLTPQK